VQLSLSSACLYHMRLGRVFRLAAGAGFEGIELVMGPEVWLRGPEYVRRLSGEHGLPVLSVHQSLLPVGPGSRLTTRMVDAVEMAVALGSRHVVLHPPFVETWDHAEGQSWLEELETCLQRVTGTATRLTVENPGRHSRDGRPPVLGRIEDLCTFADAHDLGITLDTCHLGLEGLELEGAYETVQGHVANVHLSNLSAKRSRIRLPLVSALLAEHRMPDDGYLRLGRFLSLVSANGYHGPITCEVSPVWLKAWSRQGVRERLRHCVEFAHQAT